MKTCFHFTCATALDSLGFHSDSDRSGHPCPVARRCARQASPWATCAQCKGAIVPICLHDFLSVASCCGSGMEGLLQKIEFCGARSDNLRYLANCMDCRDLDDASLRKPVGKSATHDAASGVPARAPASSRRENHAPLLSRNLGFCGPRVHGRAGGRISVSRIRVHRVCPLVRELGRIHSAGGGSILSLVWCWAPIPRTAGHYNYICSWHSVFDGPYLERKPNSKHGCACRHRLDGWDRYVQVSSN